MADLRHIDVWVFDLDNTLYDAECRLFAEIDARMAAFIENRLAVPTPDAKRLQKDYYVRYGTTMSGLMNEHDVCPIEFMDYVHDIDLSALSEDKSLARAIDRLPGKKYIYTNGSAKHAENVTRALGIADCFNDVFDIQAAQYQPKPHRAPFEAFYDRFGISPSASVMFEDLAQNLEPAHALGATTVLVTSDAAWIKDEPADKRPALAGETGGHIHHVTDNIRVFLENALTSDEKKPA